MVVLTSFVMPDTPVHLEQRGIKVILDKKEIGIGTLFISERTLGWKDGDIGFSLSYPNISLHAVSNDPTVYPQECIYVMIDTHVQIPGFNYEEPINESGSDVESEADISELILVPEDGTVVQIMYDALKECQALNPDPSDMDEEEDIYEDADDELISNDSGAGGDQGMEDMVNNLNLNSINVNYDYSNGDHNDEIFEDAD